MEVFTNIATSHMMATAEDCQRAILISQNQHSNYRAVSGVQMRQGDGFSLSLPPRGQFPSRSHTLPEDPQSPSDPRG